MNKLLSGLTALAVLGLCATAPAATSPKRAAQAAVKKSLTREFFVGPRADATERRIVARCSRSTAKRYTCTWQASWHDESSTNDVTANGSASAAKRGRAFRVTYRVADCSPSDTTDCDLPNRDER